MSTFTALNLVEEPESEDEFDDSKEIQIEEAVKLYNTALKFHSLGPSYFDQAEAAYTELLASEIFRRPDLAADQQCQDLEDQTEDEERSTASGNVCETRLTSDGTSDSLPQILRLIYKNHGQFRLDLLRHQLSCLEDELNRDLRAQTTARLGLDHQVEALNRDASDVNLWRSISRVSQFLHSPRTAAFALESVIVSDEGKHIETQLAKAQLATVVDQIPGLEHDATEYLKIGSSLHRLVDPYAFLPASHGRPLSEILGQESQVVIIQPRQATWAALGEAILAQIDLDDAVARHLCVISIPPENQQLLVGTKVSPPKTELPTLQSGCQEQSSQSMKRTSEVADLIDHRSRSKRIKSRASMLDVINGVEPAVEDVITDHVAMLEKFSRTDGQLFEVLDTCLASLDLNAVSQKFAILQSTIYHQGLSDIGEGLPQKIAKMLQNWDVKKSKALLNGIKLPQLTPDLPCSLPNRTFAVSTEIADFEQTGLDEFVNLANNSPRDSRDLGILWLENSISLLDQRQVASLRSTIQDVLRRMLLSLHMDLFSHFRHLNKHHTIQAIFETHLDIFLNTDGQARDKQQGRLEQWTNLAMDTFSRSRTSEELALRYIWTLVLCDEALEMSPQEFTLPCLQEILTLLENRGGKSIVLLSGMELSPNVVQREIMRIKTRAFFTRILNLNDPFDIIYGLEPLLETMQNPQMVHDLTLLQTAEYLTRADVFYHMQMWSRLRDAYESIQYPAQVLRCNLMSIEILIHFLTRAEEVAEHQVEACMFYVHKFLVDVNHPIRNETAALDCLDFEFAKHLLCSLLALLEGLYVHSLWADVVTIGQAQAPEAANVSAAKLQNKSFARLQDLVVHIWTLIFFIVYELKGDSAIHILIALHDAMGVRKQCGIADMSIVKILQKQVQSMTFADYNMAQIIFDLYGMKIAESSLITDHGCVAGALDLTTALELVELVLPHAQNLSIRELMKNELRTTVEKLDEIISIPKLSRATADRYFNKSLLNRYLRSCIKPVDLFRSLRGMGGLSGIFVTSEGAPLAQKGWYHLLATMSLMKFRVQKRTAPGSLESLERAKMLYKLDLEFALDRWRGWHGLAQVFDSTLDEYTTWTSDKLENDSASLVDLQRQAILCYQVAVALAITSEDGSESEMSALYAGFATRIYSSSRAPFDMKAFSLADWQRPCNSEMQGTYVGTPTQALELYTSWKLSCGLIIRAIKHKSGEDWTLYYLLAKITWKMHTCDQVVLGQAPRISHESAMKAIINAVHQVPTQRQLDRDPVLEPHYKLLSFLHKLVLKGQLTTNDGKRLMEVSHYSKQLTENDQLAQWPAYARSMLRNLQIADRSHWHHRLAARAAQMALESDGHNWKEAKFEMMQQIFTKSMIIQVWKPDHERIGRHFVYTNRYVRLFLQALYFTNDAENLEALARRVRKRSGEFVDHSDVWQQVVHVYLRLLRDRVSKQLGFDLVPGAEEQFTQITSPEDFAENANRLEVWVHANASECQALDFLKDALEFKKLNNGLLRPVLIETLIGDIYIAIYTRHAQRLKSIEVAADTREKMRVDTILSKPEQESDRQEMDSAEVSTKRKPSGLTHREVIRRAEALIIRPPPISTPRLLALASIESLPDPDDQLLATQSRALTPQSVHDSADDENESADERHGKSWPVGVSGAGPIEPDTSGSEAENTGHRNIEAGAESARYTERKTLETDQNINDRADNFTRSSSTVGEAAIPLQPTQESLDEEPVQSTKIEVENTVYLTQENDSMVEGNPTQLSDRNNAVHCPIQIGHQTDGQSLQCPIDTTPSREDKRAQISGQEDHAEAQISDRTKDQLHGPEVVGLGIAEHAEMKSS